jgi:hypothetical protein
MSKVTEKAARLCDSGAVSLITTGDSNDQGYAYYEVKGDHLEHMVIVWHGPTYTTVGCTCQWGLERDSGCSHAMAASAYEAVRVRGDGQRHAALGRWVARRAEGWGLPI